MQAHLSIQDVNQAGLRGTIAARDVKEGENLALLPADLIVEMGSARHSSAVSASFPTCMQDRSVHRHLNIL